ncbi:hypothetical protein BEI59_07835 [Eisenbergiella tayi]|uniref:Uncharacterized protein n=1 Tax=Eisenbergiella tayi TaxID=1432052 RepID=A0A1E3UNM6_9FIRM|nr:hypothetical protein BEI59_07835 [Eisenbergiella tayi]
MQRLWMASDFIARPGMFPFCEHIRSGIFLLILSGYIVIILLSLYNNIYASFKADVLPSHINRKVHENGI